MNASERKLVREAVNLDIYDHNFKEYTVTCRADCPACEKQQAAIRILDAADECSCHAHSWEEHADGCGTGKGVKP